MKGALKTPEFAKLNPLQRVPVLVLDDGTPIAETMAICRYFEETQPQPALFGTGARERAIVEMWNRRMEIHLLQCVAQAFRHLHPAMAQLEVPQVSAWGEANKPRVLEMLADHGSANSPRDPISPAMPSRSPTLRRWLGSTSCGRRASSGPRS